MRVNQYHTSTLRVKQHKTSTLRVIQHYTSTLIVKQHNTSTLRVIQHYTSTLRVKQHNTSTLRVKQHNTSTLIVKHHNTSTLIVKQYVYVKYVLVFSEDANKLGKSTVPSQYIHRRFLFTSGEPGSFCNMFCGIPCPGGYQKGPTGCLICKCAGTATGNTINLIVFT